MPSDILRGKEFSPVSAGFIGGVTGVILIFIPFSPVIGGGIGGYLVRSSNDSELTGITTAKTGTIAGITVLTPTFLFYLFFIIFVIGRANPTPISEVVGEAIVGFGMLFGYTIGFGVIGSSLVVNYIRRPHHDCPVSSTNT
jgi:hypothetical protein